ncbi:MAG: RsmE family RNA methyltransferase [Mucinivorans sp.]
MQLFYNTDFITTATGGVAIGMRRELTAAQSHHCVNVLRMGVGAPLWVSDSQGTIYECRVCTANAKQTQVEITSIKKEYARRPYRLDLAVAPTKNFDRMEWLIEKATEVGIDSFTPLLTEHSERKVVKTERLMRIMESAAAQSQKAYLPQLNEMTSFADFVATHPAGLIAHCIDQAQERKITMPKETNYTILIGPEGDFSPAELNSALAAGYRGLDLGPSRLRTETAALYAVIAAAIKY